MSATLRDDAHAILHAALAAVDPYAAVRRTLRLEGDVLFVGEHEVSLRQVDRIVVLGAGKAAPRMAHAALEILGDRVTTATITTKDGHAPEPTSLIAHHSPLVTLEASHPVPDERGVAGAEAALRSAEAAGERDLVLCLLSGGASALWTAPAEGVTLADLQGVTDGLLKAGADIGELNAVRKHLSRISGGRLAAAAAPARVATLLISDVVGSPLDVIASGPTVPDTSTYADAVAVLARRGMDAPAAVVLHLEAGARGERPETPKPGDPAFARGVVQVVASNAEALAGAAAEAERRGYAPLVLTARLEGEARELAPLIGGLAKGARAEGLPLRPPCALLLGGETTVTVRGAGRGGRNQELALAAAIALDGEPDALVACLGTDGTDGPTDAAGGIVDGGAVGRGRALGLDARASLERNDAYPYLDATGDLLRTGPTGTNVNDVTLVLVR